jgi:hypothetical protein
MAMFIERPDAEPRSARFPVTDVHHPGTRDAMIRVCDELQDFQSTLNPATVIDA